MSSWASGARAAIRGAARSSSAMNLISSSSVRPFSGQGQSMRKVAPDAQPVQSRPSRERFDLRDREGLPHGLGAVIFYIPVRPQGEEFDPEKRATVADQVVHDDPAAGHAVELPQDGDDLVVLE